MFEQKYLYILLMLLCCAATTWADDYVIINQVMYDTPNNELVIVSPYGNGEFIELYNGGSSAVSMSGWSITGESHTEVFHFPEMVISSHAYLIIAFRHSNSPSYELMQDFPTASGKTIIYQNNVVLANQGETISLYHADTLADQIIYDGTSNITKPDRLCADNTDKVSGQYVSLHRTWVEFDEDGKVVPGTSQWKTDIVTFGECMVAEPEFGEHSLTNSQSLPTGENYILSITPLDPATRVSVGDNGISVCNNVRTQATICYYDGLGRPIETINMGASPDKNDLVQVSKYSGLHRVTQQWLPVPMQTDGLIASVSEVKSQTQSYYSDIRPYSETIYENSALDRVLGHKRQGDTWKDKPTSIAYSINETLDNVRIYTIVRDSVLKTTGNSYAAYTLQKNTVADEDGKSVTAYTDKQKRTVMEERDGNRTYYVYDDLGHLRYVLPHISPSELANGEYSPGNEILRASVYYYRYDSRGNMICKRLPGCKAQYMVYDQLGQLILKQDGNQRLAHKWTLCAYDSLGRDLYTAEIKLQQSHTDLISLFADKWSVEHYGNNPAAKSIPGTGYASTILGKNNLRLLTVNYYDNYDYIAQREPTNMRQQLRFSQESGYGLQHDNAVGMLTGTRIYNMREEGYTAYSYYYDARGRVVQSRSIHSLDGYKCTTSTEYMFDGSVAQQLTMQGRDNDFVQEHYRYIYDHAGRPLKTFYRLNNDEEILLSSFSYDETGHLVQNLLHNSQDTIAYSYDIRNMLTKTKNKHFSERLFYADSISDFSHATPYYNGNIAVAQTLRTDTSLTFVYSYDQQNRLVESQLETDGQTQPSEWFQYDSRGNIRKLQRYSGNRLIDDLEYHYNEDGNQLRKVTDQGEDADLYSTIEYHNTHTQADTTMFYDANGNLIRDLDRGITAIRYNILNLPDTILFANGNRIVNLYDAAGRKYRSAVYTVPATAVTASYDMEHAAFDPDSMEYRITEYNGNIENYYTSRDTTQRIFNAVGYYFDGSYYHYIKDHLGNICAVVNSTRDSVIQRTLYYASGVPMAQSWGREMQPYLYNGKEFIEAHGLNEYDSQARMYYATIMRTTTTDPMAEKYYHISPYAWCANNPINTIDLNGMDTIEVTYNTETEHWDLEDPTISEGDDVIYITDQEGNRTEYLFSEGEYGKRICSVRLESTEQQTLGMFYLSGVGFAGYSVEPAGEPNNAIKGVPTETGEYDISKCGGPKWTGWPEQSSQSLAAGRGVCIHYAGNHDGNYELKNQDRIAVRWSTKCMVVSNDYTLDNSGYVLYNSIKSFNTALRVAKYCGASGHTVRTINNDKGNYYICNGIKSNGIIRIIK
ncbi:MAG: lamin tail domain-containing protein [Paludibacteraceae bacterium]|nr:lamin tail domain-containing protein [Paludibacteraceae bacterium]